jgi:hypothetical protein
MLLSIVILVGLLAAAAVSIGLVVRDARRLHAERRLLSDGPMSAAGASPAAMLFYGSIDSH